MGETVTGGFALAEGYCWFLPTGARPGRPAVPQATVELIVTDTNDVSAGPFELCHAGKKCPKVPAVVPGPRPKARGASERPAGRSNGRRRPRVTGLVHASTNGYDPETGSGILRGCVFSG